MANYGSRSSGYVRRGTGDAIDAEELHVMGPVLVTSHHFPCFRRAWAVLPDFSRRFPPRLTSELR